MKVSNKSLNQYLDYDTEEKVSTIDEYKDCVVVFNDFLKSKQKDFSPCLTRGRH